MKAGKITQTVYRRSVLKQLHTDKETTLLIPSQEESCYGIRIPEAEQILVSNVTLYGNEKDLCIFAMAKAANDLTAKGAKVKGFGIEILLPDFAFESRLKMMIALAQEAAQREGLQIIEANARIIPAIQTTIVNVKAFGIVREGQILQCRMARPEQDIVLVKWIGQEGVLRIKREKEEELNKMTLKLLLIYMKHHQNITTLIQLFIMTLLI